MTTRSKILVTGALGTFGTELVKALREHHGATNVIAADLATSTDTMQTDGPYFKLDIFNKQRIRFMIRNLGVGTIYHLGSASYNECQQNPARSWEQHLIGLMNILDVARYFDSKIFYSSSIAVFGTNAPKKVQQHITGQPQTLYGVMKNAGEQLCNLFHQQHNLDIRGIRFPAIVSQQRVKHNGSVFNIAGEMICKAKHDQYFNCPIAENTRMQLIYLPDAVRATIELMAGENKRITVRTAYNIRGITCTPLELNNEINQHIPGFKADHQSDSKQQTIAGSLPHAIDDVYAIYDWGWKPEYNLETMVSELLAGPKSQVNAI